MKNPRVMTWILLGLIVVGVGLLIGAAAAYWSTRSFLSSAVTAEGAVVAYAESRDSDGSLSYYPIVAFTPKDGAKVEFRSSAGGSRRGPIGERVAVLYDPRNPQRAEIHSFLALWLAPVILLALGVGFAGVGAALLFVLGRQTGSRGGAGAERLRAEGQRLRTAFQDVIVDRSQESDGRNPYRITTQWRDPVRNEVHVFESEPLWFNPRDYIPAGGIDVYVDPLDPRKYHMDTSFLPRPAGGDR
jgi:hypothetical protein